MRRPARFTRIDKTKQKINKTHRPPVGRASTYQHRQDRERRDDQKGHDAERRRYPLDPRSRLVVPKVFDIEIPEVEGEGKERGGRHDQRSLTLAYIGRRRARSRRPFELFRGYSFVDDSLPVIFFKTRSGDSHVVADHIPI